MTSQWLSSGACDVGIGVQPLSLRDDLGMAGYSLSGLEGTNSKELLYARALSIRDQNGQIAVICIVDLMCPSLTLTQKIAGKVGGTVPPEHVMLLGTHTHSAPGHYYQNKFFRYFAQPWVSGYMNYNAGWVDQLATPIAQAISDAVGDLQAGWIGIDQRRLWGASRNRSLNAFNQHPDAVNWNTAGRPGELPAGGLDSQQSAVDPRVTTIVARVGDEPRAAFGWFGCHATALGPEQPTYHRDWPGQAVTLLENQFNEFPGFYAAVGLAASGDVSPLPDLDDPGGHQGEPLASTLGHSVADVMAQSVYASTGSSGGILSVNVCAGSWSPTQENPALDWEVGWPTLGGAEDGRSFLYPFFSEEGMYDGGAPPAGDTQHPKQPALGILQFILGAFGLDVAPWHPWHRFILGNHALVAVPGEPTTLAAHELEKNCVATLGGINSATVVGYNGDYVGYFTTEEEYSIQHYEGAMTIYGRPSLASLEAAVTGDCMLFEGFPAYDESTSDESSIKSAIRELTESPVLITVPKGHHDGEQVFALWLGDIETKAEYLSLKDGSGIYDSNKVLRARTRGRGILSTLLPGTGQTMLVARFPGAPARPEITPATPIPVLSYEDGATTWNKECRDGRNIGID